MIKCSCEKSPWTRCVSCGTGAYLASGQDLEDIRVALDAWVRSPLRTAEEAVSIRAMKRILKDTWRAAKSVDTRRPYERVPVPTPLAAAKPAASRKTKRKVAKRVPPSKKIERSAREAAH